MADASPSKWHLAHTTWFFERFVLAGLAAASAHDPGWDYLFNSYYKSIGPAHARPQRGLLSRPSLQQERDYRQQADAQVQARLAAGDLDPQALAAPMPRAYEFVDGSAYLPHVERVRRARGAEVPESFYTDPLMYQATSAGFYGPRDAVKVVSEDYGIDLEAEIVVITDDVPMAATPEQAAGHIQLVGLVNDVSLRNLIPGDLAKGFGFLQS
ncbi:hypothetical protein G6F58_012815 [Rhizopus delemar]|nr:hypothetical protein G6F58_012815 [Rhizopus delemar]